MEPTGKRGGVVIATVTITLLCALFAAGSWAAVKKYDDPRSPGNRIVAQATADSIAYMKACNEEDHGYRYSADTSSAAVIRCNEAEFWYEHPDMRGK